MKLDENFRIETFNQLLLRYNDGLGKHSVLESKRPLEVQRLAESERSMDRLIRTVHFMSSDRPLWLKRPPTIVLDGPVWPNSGRPRPSTVTPLDRPL